MQTSDATKASLNATQITDWTLDPNTDDETQLANHHRLIHFRNYAELYQLPSNDVWCILQKVTMKLGGADVLMKHHDGYQILENLSELYRPKDDVSFIPRKDNKVIIATWIGQNRGQPNNLDVRDAVIERFVRNDQTLSST